MRAVRAVPGAATPFLWSCLARLPGLMTPLAVVVVVQQIRGSYTIAGIASALFAAGTAIGSPLLGRMMQRFGQTRVIVLSSTLGAALLVAVAAGESRGQPVALLLVLVGGAGLVMPPFAAAMRAVWTTLAPDRTSRDAGYALDAIAAEILFVVGPLLVSGTLLLGADTVPLLLSASFVLAGGIGYARSAPVRALGHGPRSTGPGAGALRHPGVVAALAVGSLTAATMGLIDTALIGVSEQDLGGRALIGVLIACIVAGSVVGGVVYGGRTWSATAGRRSAVAQAVLAVLAAPVVAVAFLPGGVLPALLITLTLFGTLLAPCLILQMAVVDERLPERARLFGQACLVGANTGGVAIGTALGGVAVDALGGAGALACALPVVAAAAVVAARAAGHPGVADERDPAGAVEFASNVKDV